MVSEVVEQGVEKRFRLFSFNIRSVQCPQYRILVITTITSLTVVIFCVVMGNEDEVYRLLECDFF